MPPPSLRPFRQFSLRTLLILLTLAAIGTLPVFHFLRNRWRFRHYEPPDIVRERALEWMRKNAADDPSSATMQSQESDLPTPQ